MTAVHARNAYRETGALQGSATALAGYPGMFHRLRAEHESLSRMVGRMLQLEQGLARGALLTRLQARLLSHLRGESHAFYPYLGRFQDLRPLVSRCIAGHRAIDVALHAVAASADGPRQEWNACLQRLATALSEHIACEEDEVFPLANELLSRRRAQQMLSRYQSDRERG
jgi:iron-sulfur cluster repair protein YtfE (RIC family)